MTAFFIGDVALDEYYSAERWPGVADKDFVTELPAECGGSIANAAGHGIDISGLRARQLAAADYRQFDWLLCADKANLREVRARAPKAAHARSALLLDWCNTVTDGEVPDPYTGGPAQFEHVFQLLDRAADGAIARLREELGLRG